LKSSRNRASRDSNVSKSDRAPAGAAEQDRAWALAFEFAMASLSTLPFLQGYQFAIGEHVMDRSYLYKTSEPLDNFLGHHNVRGEGVGSPD
jgi:hypothetical protein